MAENDVALLIISLLLIFVVISVVVLLRVCMFRCIPRKKSESTNQQSQVTTTSTRTNQMRSASSGTEWTESDYQIIFERMRQPQHLRSVSRFSSTTPATQIVQEMAEHFRYDRLQVEYERQTQERRDMSERFNQFVHMPPRLDANNNGVTGGVTDGHFTEVSPNSIVESRGTTFGRNVSYSTPAPRYIAEDHELPSYEAAVATVKINR